MGGILKKDFDQIYEADNVEQALKILRVSKPDIVIVDICLGRKENGLQIIKQSQEEHLITKFLMLTSSYRRDDFNQAKDLEVSGYILKDSDIEDISYAVKSIKKGKSFFDSNLQQNHGRDLYKELRECLTDREYEILRALGKGITNQQIAKTFFITENTVKKHISNLLSKLQLAHRTEAVLYAAKLWRREED